MSKIKPIREGDRVRIVTPRVVVRVGYPKTVDDYVEAARRKYGDLLVEDMNKRCVDKALQQIAYGFAKADGFGGRERSLHCEDVPELAGQVFTVDGVRMVQTGTYYPPHAWVSHCGEHDYEPGGLENMKARRLISGFCAFGKVSALCARYEISAEHVERV